MKKSKGMTRRQFLKNAAFGAAGLAALSILGPGVLTSAAAEGTTSAAAVTGTNPLDLAKRTVLLNNGVEMPVLGLGTFGLNNTQAENSAYWALKAGHRLIDTASAYNNEAAVGRGIKRAIDEGIVKREEIFVTTKLWPMGGYNAGGIDAALEKLGLEYIDLMLLHQPMGITSRATRPWRKRWLPVSCAPSAFPTSARRRSKRSWPLPPSSPPCSRWKPICTTSRAP